MLLSNVLHLWANRRCTGYAKTEVEVVPAEDFSVSNEIRYQCKVSCAVMEMCMEWHHLFWDQAL